MKGATNNNANRRKFIKGVLVAPLLSPLAIIAAPIENKLTTSLPNDTPSLKVSLNAFSFNGALSSGKMTIQDMLTFCADKGFLAVDITAYYFPGYPAVPPDDFLYNIKRKAFSLGLEISGT